MQPIGTDPGLPELYSAFEAWLRERADAHARFKSMPRDFGERSELLRELQHEMFDAGWVLYGWPEEHGGNGGTVLHRAVIVDALQRNGYGPRHLFEHLDILPPALVRFGKPELVQKVFLPTLRGDVLWCQGFSEPTAGSDLAALRTKAQRVDGGWRVDGHKIWTSWAKWATHCFFLARTGTPEERHRGLSAFVVDMTTPGIDARPIRQANGTDELAEVYFDGVMLPDAQMVGEPGQGWAVAMHILAGERGSYTWLRQCELLPRLEELSRAPAAAESAEILGELLTRLLALRSRSRAVIEILAGGEEPGPESSVSKVMVIDTEQRFYEIARDVLSPGIDLGTCEDHEAWQESYLYSRASSIYGGSRQIQLNVIARLMVGKGGSARDQSNEDRELVRGNVLDALEKSESTRDALAGLDWFEFAAAPDDAFGRHAFGSWFEAQGRSLVTSPALAAVRGAAVADAVGLPAQELAVVVAGDPSGLALALGLDDTATHVTWQGPDGARIAPAEGLVRVTSSALDAGLLQGVRLDGVLGDPVSPDATADARALSLARIAAAHEILGASRDLLDRAVAHTNQREQFGQPISGFQAIQHMLSESQIDVSALGEMCEAALEQWSAGDAHDLAAAVKALAGRAGRAVAQRARQCFGAIAVTEEHEQHLYSRRIHTLDAILGTRRELEAQLGRELVASGRAPRCIEAWRPDQPL